jgi:hypothetical protein
MAQGASGAQAREEYSSGKPGGVSVPLRTSKRKEKAMDDRERVELTEEQAADAGGGPVIGPADVVEVAGVIVTGQQIAVALEAEEQADRNAVLLDRDEQTWFEGPMCDNGFTRDFINLESQFVKAAVQGQEDQGKQFAPLLEDLDAVYALLAGSKVLAAFSAGWYMANRNIRGAEEATEKEIAYLRNCLKEYRETLKAKQTKASKAGLKLV